MSKASIRTPRRLLYHFLLNYFIANLLFSLLIGLNYLSEFPRFQSITTHHIEFIFIWSFIFISYVAQISLLFLFGLAFIALIIALIPSVWLTLSLSTALGALLLLLLMMDTIVFKLFHMHYALLGWQIYQENAIKQQIPLGMTEIVEIAFIILIFLLFEMAVVFAIWRRCKSHQSNKNTRRVPSLSYVFITFICFSICVSYSLNYLARNSASIEQNKRLLVLKATRYLPYYDELYQFLIPSSNRNQLYLTNNIKITFPYTNNEQPLHYPIKDLYCSQRKKPLNILVIMIDTWRFDAMNAKATPTIYQFAQQGLQFKNHWSGGNCTKAGVFSFFYGLPSNYWDAMLKQHHGSELFHQLIKANYQTAIFSSTALNFPAFNQTVFNDIKSSIVYTPGNTTIERDQNVTKHFKQFLRDRNPEKPFFSFVFYDAVHNYCEPEKLKDHPFKKWCAACNRFTLTPNDDPMPYMHRYLNSVYFDDNEVKEVLNALKKQDLLKNTLIVITGDHGEEINDNKSGYWQHASAYTSHQLHVPFIIYWPDKAPKAFEHFTTHYDFVPTILSHVLNCKNPPEDYTIGTSLFSKLQRPVLIAGGYMDYAIISKNQTMRIFPGGDYSLDDEAGHPTYQSDFVIEPVLKATNYLQNYYYKTFSANS